MNRALSGTKRVKSSALVASYLGAIPRHELTFNCRPLF